MFHKLDEHTKITLQQQLNNFQDENNDLRIQIKEIDFQVSELIDLQVKLRKKQLKELRHNLTEKQFLNAQNIAHLQNTLSTGGYEINEETINEVDKNGR